jgi:hypothetical protein
LKENILNSYCSVCKNTDCEEGDNIIKCDLCLNEVHQKCYGSELLEDVTKGKWYCQRCKYIIENGKEEEPVCYFCPNLNGVMKYLLIESNKKERNNNIWAHLACVNWIVDVSFVDEK